MFQMWSRFVAPVAAVLLYGGFAIFWMIERSLFGRSGMQA
jgi:hypothetical protein